MCSAKAAPRQDVTERPEAGSGPAVGVRRVLLFASAVVAALFCAIILVNNVIMPLIVRQGDLVVAPELIGRPLIEATRATSDLGLRLQATTERPDPEIPAGHVVDQTPVAGVDIKRGRTVEVVLSAGIDLKIIPAFGGVTARQAELELERMGFFVDELIEVHTNRVERGRVVGTHPGSGAVLPAGSRISMMVSLGPKPREFVMPSLIGRTPEEARLIAEGLGLVVRSMKYERGRSDILRDVVVVQDPVAGSRVVEGEGVTLRVGKG